MEKQSTPASQSYIHTQSSTATVQERRRHRQRSQLAKNSCARCSGLFIREQVIGIHFSGFVRRCINCGATEYMPVGPW